MGQTTMWWVVVLTLAGGLSWLVGLVVPFPHSIATSIITGATVGYSAARMARRKAEIAEKDDERSRFAVETLRYALATSDRWKRLVNGIDLMTLARAGRLRVEDFDLQQMIEVTDWVGEKAPEVPAPAVLTEYLDPLR